ncbi:MAG TPA: hypothetical protein VFA43_04190 [Gemmatimonadaceae bacterium]|nr:hypothetical protein [Gemmatimonadaceae bacterium]
MRAVFVGLAAAAALGCATAGSSSQSTGELRDVAHNENGQMLRTTPDYAITGSVSRPVDEAYAGMLLAYQKLGIEAAINDPVNHHVGNTAVNVLHRWNGEDLSRFFECGRDAFQTPRADQDRITFSVVTTLGAAGTADTKVETLVTARGTDPGANGSTVYCSTTGHLEALLLKLANQQ